jgi:hypothetical protein
MRKLSNTYLPLGAPKKKKKVTILQVTILQAATEFQYHKENPEKQATVVVLVGPPTPLN